jgi:hypothetical protein
MSVSKEMQNIQTIIFLSIQFSLVCRALLCSLNQVPTFYLVLTSNRPQTFRLHEKGTRHRHASS